MKVHLWKMVSVSAIALLVLSGCETLSGSSNKMEYEIKDDVFDFDGMPDRKYLVGGGYFIVYRATTAGELFLADDASDRLLATVSLQPGEEHEIIYDIMDEKMAANLDALGIDPQKAELKLYFVPR